MFPLCLWIIHKLGINVLKTLCLIFAASFSASLWIMTFDPPQAFFMPYSRWWELTLGGILAVAQYQGTGFKLPAVLSGGAWRDLCPVLGLGFFCSAIFLIHRNSFPGAWALLPALGSAGILLGGQNALFNRSVLSSKPAVFIGLISYPLYLWHWPLMSYGHILWGEAFTSGKRLALMGLSFLLAAFTYAVIEKPFRGTRSYKKIFSVCSALLLLAVLGLVIWHGTVKPYSHRFGVDKFLYAAQDWDHTSMLKEFSKIKTYGSSPRLTVFEIPSEGPKTIYIGDSNMQQYAPRIGKMLSGAGGRRGAYFIASGGTRPVPGFFIDATYPHKELFEAFEDAYADPAVDTVVLAASWYNAANKICHVDGFSMDTAEGKKRFEQNLTEFISRIKREGKRVVLIGSLPLGRLDPKKNVVRGLWPVSFTIDATQGAYLERMRTFPHVATMDPLLQRVVKATGIEYIEPKEYLCADGFCPAVDERLRLPIYKDGGHLANTYVREHMTFLDDLILGRK